LHAHLTFLGLGVKTERVKTIYQQQHPTLAASPGNAVSINSAARRREDGNPVDRIDLAKATVVVNRWGTVIASTMRVMPITLAILASNKSSR
jgi:hypothetical protein